MQQPPTNKTATIATTGPICTAQRWSSVSQVAITDYLPHVWNFTLSSGVILCYPSSFSVLCSDIVLINRTFLQCCWRSLYVGYPWHVSISNLYYAWPAFRKKLYFFPITRCHILEDGNLTGLSRLEKCSLPKLTFQILRENLYAVLSWTYSIIALFQKNRL